MTRTATILSLLLISGLGSHIRAQPVRGLSAPLLIEPSEGDTVVVEPPTFTWEAVEHAEQYRLEWSEQADFKDYHPYLPTEETHAAPSEHWFYCEPEQDTTVYWRVRAEAGGAPGPYSDVRSFHYVYYERDWEGDGAGIVEIAHPNIDPCVNPLEPGCADYGGNTVWQDPNVSADYYVTGGGGNGGISRLSRYIETAVPDDYEIRFTEAGGHAIYFFSNNQIARVPFELWNVGEPSEPDQDVRMIPFLVNGDRELLDWTDQFTGTDPWLGSPCGGGCPVTDWVYFMMPDRDNGYELFEQSAIAFGGAGAIYDPTTDGDTQIDVNPLAGAPCNYQGHYVDFCYRTTVAGRCTTEPGLSDIVYPVGRVVFADLARDGTTPPPGTIVRFITNDSPLDDRSEPPDPDDEPDPEDELPDAYVLLPAYPNPFNPSSVVPFETPEPSRVRITAHNILGQEVAVLADSQLPAGRHEVVFSGDGLSSGVYLIQLQADLAVRAARKVLLLR